MATVFATPKIPLEMDTVSGAFTSDRVQTLGLHTTLFNQGALSFENACVVGTWRVTAHGLEA